MEDHWFPISSCTAKNFQGKRNPQPRTISVHAEGEAICPPNLFTFTITVTSAKEKLEEAQRSVKRRKDYILQVLRNHGYRNDHIKLMEEVSRQEGLSEMRCVIIAEGREINKILATRNTLAEKMDETVQCGNIQCSHTTEHKAQRKEEAFKVAVSQARSKAQSVSQCLGVNLGSVLSLVEDKLEEKCMDQDKESVDVVERDSISYMASISVVFEVIPIKNNIRKK